ncbi:Protein kinase domain [Arabidopsis thaliana x Arabidopsis arenosa]|uniref:Protein kinase domain n=2 Tax=Brassicaceae TaxID=3700 RepID=A0A8T2C731_9BRAS|nr:Protein kinase domain [Arabidopsis thaliana x Arabidopsis arenosa]
MTTNKRFTYSEVVKMTNNFQRILGKGGFGIVYYGSVNGTEEVAVKMLSQSSSQGYKQFKAEVELLLRVHHKNLVGLVGYCDEGDKLALIYEYMANGDLDEHMSGKRGGSFLNWATRLKIVAESAQGLEYLHNGCKPLMVHRDIKTTNILLNEHLQAKLADFGLSRSFPIEGETHVSTVVAGTIGYLDPEYYRTNWLTEKSDVYSFGIVILEIITNKPVIDQNREKRHIAEWVGQMLTKGDIKSITDPSLHGDYDSGSVWKAVELAMSCLNPSSVNRPTMTQVVSELNECLASENLRGGQSQEMDSQSSIEVSMTFDPESNPAARYPDDVYDRIWNQISPDQDWQILTTNLQINASNDYDLPQRVIKTAVTPIKASTTTMEFTWKLKPPTSQFYLFLHFAELESLQAKETREFNVVMNGNVTLESYSPKFLQMQTVYSKAPKKCDGGECLLRLVKTSKSTLPPLINAIEAFTVLDFSQLETNGDEVVAIKNIQSTYGLSKINWQGDPCVPKLFLWDGLNCNNSDASIPPIITSLDLSNNNLIGGVPEFLADMKSLLVINLSGNNLSGLVPQKLLEKKMLKLNIEGNPKLHCTVESCVKDGEGGRQKKSMTIPIVASIAFVVALIVALIIFCVIRKNNPSNDEAPTSCMLPSGGRSSEPTIETKNKNFTYAEVITMTNNFQRILGKGGFGIVYYGSVNGTEQVAVKMLSHSSAQGYKQFKAEVELLLLRVHHKNLVGLVGYCEEGDKLALIYEYMANGDLDEHMSGKRGGSILNWGTRLKIAVEAAQGLEYLHNGCKPLMVHRDIKTTNILLNEHFHTKLADFGLSRSFPIEGETHVSTVVAGTIGYLDPEYYRTNWLTEKSDVYSFGVVLLVIITNQPVIDQTREKRHIAEWVGVMLTKGDIKSITDPNLLGDYNSGSVWKAVELAMSCLNPSSMTRPTMSQVVFELKECLASESSRGGESQEMYSHSSREVSMTFGTEVAPMAR